jgi:RNA polymerase sigma factor FliA
MFSRPQNLVPLTPDQQKLVEDNIGLVDKEVRRGISTRSWVQRERPELISYGYFGLVDAARKFDPSRNFKFATYARFRIRGAIKDFIRAEVDWLPGRTRKRLEDNGQFIPKMIYESQADNKGGGAHTESVVEVNSSGEIRQQRGVRGSKHEFRLDFADWWDNLCKVNKISPRDRIIIEDYVLREFTMKQISVNTGLTESRVCQIVHRWLKRLGEKYDEESILRGRRS